MFTTVLVAWIFFTSCAYSITRGVKTKDLETTITLPVTYYLEHLESASTQSTGQTLYHASLCAAGINGRKHAVLQIYSKENPTLNTSYGNPYIVAQVSRCNNQFTQDCVFATNYQFGVDVLALPEISWTVNASDTDYWIRVMGQFADSEYSMELSFNDTESDKSYPWNQNVPFNTESVSTSAQSLLQYWKGSGEYTVSNAEPLIFSISYCKQENYVIPGIDISVAAIPNTNDYSLLQQWACPQTTPVQDCSSSNVQYVGWFNFKISSFNLLQCPIANGLTTDNGIWVYVSGYGANIDHENTFTFYATEHASS